MGIPLVAPPAPAAARTAKHAAAAKTSYVCPHCGVISAAAGKCPYCHVALMKSHSAKAVYECAMCNIKSAKAGKCPQCGMAMTKVTAKSHKM